MTVVEAFDPNEIRLSDNAVSKLRALLDDEGNDALKFRVYITGGGCSGFQYGFTLDEEQNEDDFDIEKDGVHILIDALSSQYVQGAEVDWKEDAMGAQFAIKNPNAQTTCGCGSSFSV